MQWIWLRHQTAQVRHKTVQQGGIETPLTLDHHKVDVTLGHMLGGCSVPGHIERLPLFYSGADFRSLPRHATRGRVMNLPTLLAALKPAIRFDIKLKYKAPKTCHDW